MTLWLFHGSNHYLASRVYGFVILCPGAPEGSAGSGSGLESFRRWGYSLKSHLTESGAGRRTQDPWVKGK